MHFEFEDDVDAFLAHFLVVAVVGVLFAGTCRQAGCGERQTMLIQVPLVAVYEIVLLFCVQKNARTPTL